jgi:hypothetical protein
VLWGARNGTQLKRAQPIPGSVSATAAECRGPAQSSLPVYLCVALELLSWSCDVPRIVLCCGLWAVGCEPASHSVAYASCHSPRASELLPDICNVFLYFLSFVPPKHRNHPRTRK